jgi:preprotein translocase subunit SecD
VAPPSSTKSRPGRALAVLAALIIVMLVGILGKDAFQPAKWQSNFRVQLGLDLSSGTTVTLKAVTVHNTQPSAAAMTTAIAIMNSRVNGAGFTGAVVQQQGSNVITVAVPGKGGAQVVKLVGTTAQLRFRQVLLEASNTSLAAPVPTPTPSAPASPSPSAPASPSAKASSSAKVSPTPSSSAAALGAPGAASGGHSLSSAARQLAARPRAAASAKPTSSASPTASASPSPSATTPPATRLSTTADAQGNAALVSAPVKALFDKLNCADPNWQQKIYNGDPTKWDDVNSQVVSCQFIKQANGAVVPVKYALAKATVVGTMVTAATATLSTTSTSWQVNISFNGAGTTAFGNLTTSMFDTYGNNGNPTSPLDQLAVVLDGNIVSSPNVISPSTAGQTMITGGFNEQQATLLANQLSYGHLPLTFKNQSTDSISPELGSSQLHAGLIAAGIGLLLVVLYSFLYYRGLGLVSVSSLIIAALLSYLSVVLLSKYQGYSLSLSGVAGLIVAIGITADSFVVFFERLRDEVRDGRSLRAAVERGWQRARRTILVSDTVSFLAALMLWYFSIDDVKGFAFTLGLTTMIDIIVVFLFTKPMVTLLARTRFYGNGHPLSGLDPARLGARTPWRGAKRVTARPATSGAAGATARPQARTTPKEA